MSLSSLAIDVHRVQKMFLMRRDKCRTEKENAIFESHLRYLKSLMLYIKKFPYIAIMKSSPTTVKGKVKGVCLKENNLLVQ